MRVAVASGKGGTGKTTVALALALSLPAAQLVDADAEEPNVHLFLDWEVQETIPVTMMAPEVDAASCDGCGRCAEFCQFNALAVVRQRVLVFRELCHGCGGCAVVCPQGAIRAVQRRIGEVEVGRASRLRLIQGRLRPGEPSAVRIVQRELEQLEEGSPVIVDAPPGTACAVQEVMAQADYCLLVTEPTPFGRHDLGMAMDLCAELKVPCGVVINRSGKRDDLIEEECDRRGVPVLLRISFSRAIAEAYARGRPLVDGSPGWRVEFAGLWRRLEKRAAQ